MISFENINPVEHAGYIIAYFIGRGYLGGTRLFRAFRRQLAGHYVKIKIGHRLRCQRSKRAVQLQHISFAVGVVSIRQENIKRFGKRIDPQRRACPASVAKRAARKMRPSRSAVARINVPTQPAPRRYTGRRLHRCHQLYRFWFENPHAVQDAFVQQHPRISRQVRRCRKQAGMSSYPAHVSRRRIMHCSPQHHFRVRRIGLRWRNALSFTRRRQESGIDHLERLINLLLHKIFQLHSAHALHNRADHEQVHVAISKCRSGLRPQLFRAGFFHRGFKPVPIRFGFHVRQQPRGVRQ